MFVISVCVGSDHFDTVAVAASNQVSRTIISFVQG